MTSVLCTLAAALLLPVGAACQAASSPAPATQPAPEVVLQVAPQVAAPAQPEVVLPVTPQVAPPQEAGSAPPAPAPQDAPPTATGNIPGLVPASEAMGGTSIPDIQAHRGRPLTFVRHAADEFAQDLPPAIGEVRRILLLAKLVRAEPTRHAAADQAVGLARELARLLDHVRTERLDFAGLEKLVPDEFAEHWQRTLQFLKIVTENWPRALDEEKRLDAADRRNRLLAARAAAWRAAPPTDLVVAAGTTGTVSAMLAPTVAPQ